MSRTEKFESYATHPWLHKAYRRLKADELEAARRFLRDNAALSKDAFVMAVQRMYLGNPAKPKNWAIINELLTCAGTGAEHG